MTSYYTYTYIQGATPSQWANGYTNGPAGAALNCYPSPTSSIGITYTFLAAASGCPVGYSFSSNIQQTTSSTCILTEGLRTPVTYTWDCVFTVGGVSTSTINGGTTTVGNSLASTITAPPQTITVTQTLPQTTTATSIVNPGATTVSVTSTVTQGASAAPKRRAQFHEVEPKYRGISNIESLLQYDQSNSTAPLLERACTGYQCSSLCCTGGQTCVGDGHYCCPGYNCVPYNPAAPFIDYYASWLSFTAPIRTYTSYSYISVTTFATKSVTGSLITVTPTSTYAVTVTSAQTVNVLVTQTGATVTITVLTTVGGSSPANPGSSPTNPVTTAPTTIVPTLVVPISTTSIPPISYTTAAVITGTTTSISHASVAQWTGSGKLLNGYCSVYDYMLLDGVTAYWVPFVGCDSNKLDCCPFGVASTPAAPSSTAAVAAKVVRDYPVPASATQGTLSQCPDDYQTVSSGCCPSGYSLWNTPLGGQVPCFTALSSNLVPPPIRVTAAVAANSTPKPTQAIINVAYAMYYPVASSPSGLSVGAKAGIGVGVVVVVLVIIALLIFFFIKRRKGKKSETESSVQSPVAESVHPTIMSQYTASEHQGLEPYTKYSIPEHQGIEAHDGHTPLGGYLPQDHPDYGPRPAYQSWPPITDQNWQAQQGVYPSSPTSTSSPPPGSDGFAIHGGYTGPPQELHVVHERPELGGHQYPTKYEMSG